MNHKKNKREFLLSLMEGEQEVEINNFWLVKCFNKENDVFYISVFTQKEYKEFKENK